MSLDVELTDRRALIEFLKSYCVVDETAPSHALIRKTKTLGGGNDPLIARAIRRLEDGAANARAKPPPADDTASRNDAWLAGHLVAEMDGDKGIVGSTVAQFVAEVRNEICDQFKAEIEMLRNELSSIKQKMAFDTQFREAELRFVERQERLHEARRGPQGKPGARGERGAQGRPGRDGRDGTSMTVLKVLGIKGWAVDAADYSARLILADGSRSAKLDLRPLFEHFFHYELS